MKLYTVDTTYIKKLHSVDPEVFYSSANYDNKPYVGIVVFEGKYSYFIPLTSAKQRHKTWKNVSEFNYLIYEFVHPSMLNTNAIFVGDKHSPVVKHILSVLEIRKMIPVPVGYYNEINISGITDIDYRNLLMKEFFFLKPLFADIQKKATDIYKFQIENKKVFPIFCNFKELEKVCDTFSI